MSWQQAVLLASSGHSCLTGRSAILILDEQTYTKHRSLKERERENDVYILFFCYTDFKLLLNHPLSRLETSQ